MGRDMSASFHNIVFFIGYTEKGVTKEARQTVAEDVLEHHARKGGSKAVRDFLHAYVFPHMLEALLRDFLKELVEREQSDAEQKALLSKALFGRHGMEDAVAQLLEMKRNDSPDSGCDSAAGDV